jgi:hypothetical protein
LMDPDYLQIGAGGDALDKERVLASFRSGERHWDEAHSDEHHVRIYGNTAVVVGRWRARGENAGRVFDYQARFVSVWVSRDGELDWATAAGGNSQRSSTSKLATVAGDLPALSAETGSAPGCTLNVALIARFSSNRIPRPATSVTTGSVVSAHGNVHDDAFRPGKLLSDRAD